MMREIELTNDRQSSKVHVIPTNRSNRFFSRGLATGMVLLATVVLMGLLAKIENWKRDLTTNFAKLDATSDDPLLRPFVLAGSPADVAGLITQWVGRQGQWKLQSQVDEDAAVAMHLTRTTSVLRFTDDVHVRLVAVIDGTRVEAESRSRIGVGDLGQNPKNLRELAAGLKQER